MTDAWQISIHAPAKGATFIAFSITSVPEFQSTLPRRERHIATGVAGVIDDFNPRSREGSDYSGHIV